MMSMPTPEEIQSALRFFRQGGALRMLLNQDVTPELSVLFRYALQLVEVGEYSAATRLFKLLTMYDAWSFDYWFQLGVCCQSQSLWSDAIYAYGRAAQIRLNAPEVPYAAAECYQACGNSQYARKALRAARLICGDASEHRAFRRQVEEALTQLGDEDE